MTSLGGGSSGTTGGILSNASHYTLSGLTSTNTTTTAIGSSSLYTGLSSLTGAGLTGCSSGYGGHTSSGAGGLISSASSHALTSGGLSLLDNYTNPVSSSSATSGYHHHHYTTGSGSASAAAAAAAAHQNAPNVSPLPIRAHPISTMPPLCQVRPNS